MSSLSLALAACAEARLQRQQGSMSEMIGLGQFRARSFSQLCFRRTVDLILIEVRRTSETMDFC